MKPPQLSPCNNAAQQRGSERVSTTTTGRGWRRVDTITRVRDKRRGMTVTIEYRHYGPLGWLFDALFRW
ncbi:MAG: hypothetical protein WCP99_07680, partial [Burkholderiales bacterium]